ncbi:putative phosphatase regulatory subunit-domain-containing protein [Xylariaceae sp. FL0594]|nr:putative phosphatase regulatory subunit-domain-containing protein [Xylariaceae sp. FL0594]
MPYTPPSHSSPASSAPSSPAVSRRSSFNSSSTPTRPPLPRSASYLTRYRRTASATALSATPTANNGSTPDITPPGTSDNLKGLAMIHSSSIRQSPPPVANAQGIPPGAIISPPESSSEDEGVVESGDRGREMEMTSMKELKEAISAIPQVRASSPVRSSSPGDVILLTPPTDKSTESPPKPTIRTDGLDTGRKISHSRSRTESHIYLNSSNENALSVSDEGSSQDELFKKPQMVRKKSGELVRPALRPLRRPSSMPGTPTFSKAVHFDSHLEHVRHFLQVDRPLAVSAGSSPADNYDSDVEYPFKPVGKPEVRTPPYEWEIVMNNFPPETPLRKALAVRLERVWMSPDQKSLLGSVAVANLAFQKVVVCRFTFDYWKTTSEIGAEYHHEIRPRESQTGHDRFQFSIKLSDIANLESKTLYMCIRYNVNGQEYWDNNDHVNFQVDFRKKFIPQNGKKGTTGASSRPANALPRSNRRTNPSLAARPRSMPPGTLDEFGHDSQLATSQPLHEFLGETEPISLRLKSSKSTTSLPSDNLPGRLSAPSGVAFANRYDFGASLNAAMQAQKSLKSSPPQSDGLYMKAHQRGTLSRSEPTEVYQSQRTQFQITPPAPRQPSPSTSKDGPASSKTATTTAPTTTTIASASYEEILNKYCFFNGSKQSSPQLKDGTLRTGGYDGADDRAHLDNHSNNFRPSVNHVRAERISHTLHRTMDSPPHDNYITVVDPAMIAASRGSPTVLGRQPGASGLALPTGNYSTASSHSPNVAVSDRTSYHHTQHLQEISPFTKDSHAATAISC